LTALLMSSRSMAASFATRASRVTGFYSWVTI
jgi:hypothetical protein